MWFCPQPFSRAGKSSKMSKRVFLLGLKCPQSYVDKIPQYQQFGRILPHFQPQIELLRIIPTFNLGL
jgi:hypothetical protein